MEGEQEDLVVDSTSKQLEHPTVDRLMAVWRLMLLNARPHKNATVGLDGVTHHFYCLDNESGPLSG